jgi:hypothetical protein
VRRAYPHNLLGLDNSLGFIDSDTGGGIVFVALGVPFATGLTNLL